MYRERWGKYRSKRQECNKGHWHHSKFEAGKCNELRLREIAGDIVSYETQHRVRLYLGGVFMGTQTVDFFVLHKDGTKEFLETKGFHLSNESKWKRDWIILQEMFKNDSAIKFTVELCR